MPHHKPEAGSYELKDLMLMEVSLVPKGANPGAKVVTYKEAGMPKFTTEQAAFYKSLQSDQKTAVDALIAKGASIDEIMAAQVEKEADTSELDAKVAKAESDKIDAQAATAAMKSAAEAAGFTVTEKSDGTFSVVKEDIEYIEFEGEQIAKGSVPDVVFKSLKKQADKIADLEKAAENDKLQKAAEAAWPNLAGDAVAKAALMGAVNKISDDEVRGTVEKALKAADAAISTVFKEVGTQEVDPESPKAQLEKMVEDYAKENNVTKAIAFDDVTKGAGRALYTQIREAERAARIGH